MPSILDIQKKYSSKLDPLDLELLISAAIGRSREFVLAHPEFSITNEQGTRISKLLKRRLENEPIAYILGHKEFYGLDFKVDKNTLIPRPETEQIVDLTIDKIVECRMSNVDLKIIDIGTGSGNIIISLASILDSRFRGNDNMKYFATDISKDALAVAKQNAKKHKLDKKITFLHGNLLEPIIDKKKLIIDHCSLIIVANLPYLSQKIYAKTPADVKKYEPKSALFSKKEGLDHYDKLFKQIKKLSSFIAYCSLFIEISPEQKNNLSQLIKKYFPKAKPVFHKDLADKWRVCEIEI